jgi:hypothetical protein
MAVAAAVHTYLALILLLVRPVVLAVAGLITVIHMAPVQEQQDKALQAVMEVLL